LSVDLLKDEIVGVLGAVGFGVLVVPTLEYAVSLPHISVDLTWKLWVVDGVRPEKV
jgi:hypothetical protein